MNLLLRWGKKMERKKIERKIMEKRENKEKSMFSLLLFGWREMERKKIRNPSLSCLIKEKSEKKENIIILNNLFILNLI